MTTQERIRFAISKLRVTSMPLSDLIPPLQEAADELDRSAEWERVAKVQDAKLRAVCNEPGGFERLCEVMDKYEGRTQ